MNPILLADVIIAVPSCFLYDYPKSNLAAILGMILQAINPNAAERGFPA